MYGVTRCIYLQAWCDETLSNHTRIIPYPCTMPLINFALKDPTDILPWGTAPDTNIHWFGLTDGDYWLRVGDKTLYEYTTEFMKDWNFSRSQYTDYHIVRFLEDFTDLFSAIAESLPEDFYQLARSYDSLYEYIGKYRARLEQLPDAEDADLDTHYDKYEEITRWIHDRRLTSTHLKYGPAISFFRCNDKISIVWDSDHRNEKGIAVWTAGNGQIEMPYQLFVNEVKDWGERFFNSMEFQLEEAFLRDWGTTKIDKKRIKEEQAERRKKFLDDTNRLLIEPSKFADWSSLMALIKEM